MLLSTRISRTRRLALGLLAAPAIVAAMSSLAHAGLIHRYSFATDASDSVGGSNGTLTGGATVAGGQLTLANGGKTSANGQYLALSPSILPSTGSATIESWFTFTGSGFFSEDWTFSNNANDTAGPNSGFGQYMMHTISAPQPGTPPGGPNTGGSHVGQTLSGYGVETDAFETTPGLGAGGGGYLDDGGTYMTATVIDGTAGTLSYYLYRVSDGVGGLQQSITSIPLSSYAFTNAYLGRSAFAGDGATNGSVDEFRIYNNAQSASDVAADFAAGANAPIAAPEPASLALLAVGGLTLLNRRRRA